jgi:ribosomal protein L32E
MLPSVEIASQYKHYTGFSAAIIQNAKQLAKSNMESKAGEIAEEA